MPSVKELPVVDNSAEKVTVFYHSPCLDGAAAAWSAYKKWGDSAHYIGINHGDANIHDLIMQNIDSDTHVVFADFTPPIDKKNDHPFRLMDEIATKAKDVVVYDHHASAISDMKGYTNRKVTLVMDQTRSGASIVYNELFPRTRLPQAVQLAEMIDLEHTHKSDFFSIAAYIDSLPIQTVTEAIESFEHVNKTPLEDIIKQGKPIRRSNSIAIEKTMNSASWAKMEILPGSSPVYVPIINANPQLLGREFSIRLRELAERSAPGFVALSWFEDKGVVRVSVRTNGVPDAGKVAAHMGQHGIGGGGHRDSAAAQFTIDQFNEFFKRQTQQQVAEALANNNPPVLFDSGTAQQLALVKSDGPERSVG